MRPIQPPGAGGHAGPAHGPAAEATTAGRSWSTDRWTPSTTGRRMRGDLRSQDWGHVPGRDSGGAGQRPAQGLRRQDRGGRRSASRCGPGRCSASSAPTAPARPRRSSAWPGCAPATPAAIRVHGLDPWTQREEVTRIVGVQLQESRLQDKITVREALELWSAFYDDPVPWQGLVERLGLTDARRRALRQAQRRPAAAALHRARPGRAATGRDPGRAEHRARPAGPAATSGSWSATCATPA